MYKLVLMMLCTIIGSAYAKDGIFTEFATANDWVMDRQGVFEIEANFVATGKQNISTENAKILVSKTAKAISMIQNGKQVLFLNHPLGTWITQPDQPAPLKISGAYTVFGVINIDDIIALDFESTYTVEDKNGNTLHLKSKKKTNYPYIIMNKSGHDKFELIFQDRNKKDLKRGVYTLGIVNDIKIVKKVNFQDLVIDTNRHTSFEVKQVKQTTIPVTVLDPEKFTILFNLLK